MTTPDPHPAAERFRHHRILRRQNLRPVFSKLATDDPQTSGVGVWTPIDASNARAGYISIEPGKSTPPHSYSLEHWVVALEGEIRVAVEGEDYLLQQYDIVFVPAFVEYTVRNVGSSDAWLFSVTSRLDEWPARSFLNGQETVLGRPWPYDDDGRPVA
jgi:quercetin dioxygenase-like cupin family protein